MGKKVVEKIRPFLKISLGFFFLIAALTLFGQNSLEERFSSTVYAEAAFPVFGDQELFGIGFGGTAAFAFQALSFLFPFLYGGYHVFPVHGLEPMSLMDAGLGADLRFNPWERVTLGVGILGGVYLSKWRDYGTSGPFFGLRVQGGYKLSPGVTLSVHGGFFDYLSSPEPFLRAVSAGVSIHLQFSDLGNKKAKLDVQTNTLSPIFPVFYSYYDENTFGSLTVVNQEESSIHDVTISLFIPEYMSQPRRCGYSEKLLKNESLDVQLFTLLNDEVLELTENTRAQAMVTVEYRIMGVKRETSIPLELTMYHRNAMAWDDDRKAAAFVSPTDPAVLWFSRFASGIAQNRMRGDINRNLQQAMSVFEALRVYGINYVVDPNSSYIELSEQTGSIDYLQFPHQTLFFRGGDCDDISILYSALLESVGIRTGFITIPGHIYMAFSLDISEEEGRNNFYDPSMLLFIDGEAWLPVEITLVKEGFTKAWRIGAKQWTDNVKTGNAKFYPMRENWEYYQPVGIPNVNPRFSLPDEVATIERFDFSMDRYVAREILPMKERIASRTDLTEKEKQNSLGILFGRYGMLNEAWKEFSDAAKSNYAAAWTNLANIAFLQKDYELAVSYYNWALKLNPEDSIALLGISRSHYEMENLKASDEAYLRLEKKNPELASRFGYLASILGGEGRAWTFSERLTSTVWAEEAKVEEKPQPRPAPKVTKLETKPEEPEELKAERAEEFQQEAVEAEAPAVKTEVPVKEEKTQTEESESEESELKETVKETEIPEKNPPEEPPAIAEIIPEDKELKEKKESAAFLRVPEKETEREVELEYPADTEEPPAIGESIPEDQELKEKKESAAQQVLPGKESDPEPEIEKEEPVSEEPAEQHAPPEEGKEDIEAAEDESTTEPGLPEPDIPADTKRKEEKQSDTFIPDEFAAFLSEQIQSSEIDLPKSELPAIEELRFFSIRNSFRDAYPAIGSWTFDDQKAVQTDSEQLFAKLAVPLIQNHGLTRYSFYGKSTGTGWTGLGIHIYRDNVITHKGYGAGNSILIWITQNPHHYGDDKTRLQIYRSRSDTIMELQESAVIEETITERNQYDIIFNKENDTLSVVINGNSRLTLTGFSDFIDGTYVVFRAMDTSEFEDFIVEVLP